MEMNVSQVVPLTNTLMTKTTSVKMYVLSISLNTTGDAIPAVLTTITSIILNVSPAVPLEPQHRVDLWVELVFERIYTS